MLLLHRMNEPATHPAQARERAPDVLDTWLRHSPASTPVERDWEDWAENAVVLHELAKLGEVDVLDNQSNGRLCGDRTPAVVPNPNAPDGIMWGGFVDSDAWHFPVEANLLWNNRDAVARVQDYAFSPVFLKHAGRRFHVCDMDHDEIRSALRSMHADGVRRGFYKTRDKGRTRLFDMGEDPTGLWRDMDPEDDLAWLIVAREGDRKGFILQSAFRPTREYRMIVIGREVVTGAGCIESHTPLDNVGNVFDDRVEIRRNDGKIVVDVRTIDEYVAFARRYAREWADQHGEDMGYSLDLSIDGETGDVVPIEMNPLLNLGLYATRTDMMIGAMLGKSAHRS